MLAEPIRIAGRPTLDVTLSLTPGGAGTSAPLGAHLTPILVDVGPSGDPAIISRGFLNLAYRDGLTQARPVPTLTPVEATVTFMPQDYTVAAGHRVAVIIQSSNTVWAVPTGRTVQVTVASGGATPSALHLPLVAAPADPFIG